MGATFLPITSSSFCLS